ncbi:MAG TPA: Ig-like domain-containing protein [Prosthecobacter sp.]
MKHPLAILFLVCAFASADEARLTHEGQIEAFGGAMRVFRGGSQTPLFGSVTHDGGSLRFTPTLPLVAGETYRVEVQGADGTTNTHTLRFEKPRADAPAVRMAPSPAVLPANALKLYLHFSQPMEQGVFLDRITLQRLDGGIVHGAFRETELWSPDGKRLTLWLHPGRQKTGVNLNQDEGPVLIEGQKHLLKISSAWRSVAGTPLGQDTLFTITAGPPDHECPDPAQWKINTAKAATQQPLTVTFNEGMDPAMLASALHVKHGDAAIKGTVKVAADARQWSFAPLHPWQPGPYTLEIDPLLEDLAGNNLQHPFEVDRANTSQTSPRPTKKQFELTH